MRRVSKDDMELSIYIALKVAPKYLKTDLKRGLSDDNARKLAKHILGKMQIVEGIAKDAAIHHSTP